MRKGAGMTDTSAADDCKVEARNRFFRGKHMKAKDFESEQRYFVGRRRLINRAVLGWGVVYGLPVAGQPAPPDGPDGYRRTPSGSTADAPEAPSKPKPAPGPIGVGAGLALDRHGRETGLTGHVVLDPNNTFLVEDGASGRTARPIAKLAPGLYVLSIHYAERPFGDASLPDPCGCDGPEKKYVCETAVFSLQPTRECPCAEEGCDRTCACDGIEPCCAAGRGPHACLCQWVRDAPITADTPALCEWRGYWIDPSGGVPLACVTVEVGEGKCGPTLVGWIDDDCGPRRLVKNNDLLYDLVRGCDLARIEYVSWHEWHRAPEQMPWQTFADMFSADGATTLVVRFSKPVLEETLQRDVVVMWAVTTEQATGWRVARQVPIVGLDLGPDLAHLGGYKALPAGTTNQVRLRVRPEWVRDEIDQGRESWLSDRSFRVEIEIRGDFILDCHGQAVDCNAVGLRPTPTGNGTPGGTYLSNFRVEHKRRGSSDDAA